jgi:hypothetical protein
LPPDGETRKDRAPPRCGAVKAPWCGQQAAPRPRCLPLWLGLWLRLPLLWLGLARSRLPGGPLA